VTGFAPFRKVLIANRGEIAVRVMRTCRDLGISTVAVFSDADVGAPHVRLADEAYPIGPAAASESYLRADRIIEVAKRSGCDAIHPGYGFLSERADFAESVAAAGLVFIGPPAQVQRALGEKTSARRIAREAGVPIAEGTMDPVADEQAAAEVAARVGYPILLKPAGGGGGKGMRVVRGPDELASAWRGATGEATSAFGAPALLVERYLEGARHVEVQLIADQHGAVVALGERDCSIQRRHQKLIEETPAPSVDAQLRGRLISAATAIAVAARYVNAGTAEFLVTPDGGFVFLEVNTRLQVEHPVTELVTGLDLVALQLRVAAGERLPFSQREIRSQGAAIECRITAEDAYAEFLPSAGRLGMVRLPAGPGIRVDTGIESGLVVPTEYDPLLAKIVAWGPTRDVAISRLRRALAETVIAGIPTVVPFHQHVLADPDFRAGQYDTSYVGRQWHGQTVDLEGTALTAAAVAAVLTQRERERHTAPADSSGWTRAARADVLR